MLLIYIRDGYNFTEFRARIMGVTSAVEIALKKHYGRKAYALQ